jgi:hypothetical protein
VDRFKPGAEEVCKNGAELDADSIAGGWSKTGRSGKSTRGKKHPGAADNVGKNFRIFGFFFLKTQENCVSLD